MALRVDRNAGVATFIFDEDLSAPASAARFRIYTAVAGSVDEGAVPGGPHLHRHQRAGDLRLRPTRRTHRNRPVFVYAPGGTRTALSGCTRGSEPSQIVCAADRAPALGGAMEAGGLDALVHGAVIDPNGIDVGHPASRPL